MEKLSTSGRIDACPLRPSGSICSIQRRNTRNRYLSFFLRAIYGAHFYLAYKPSEFAIINTDDSPDFSIESTLRLADQQGRKLDLGINYVYGLSCTSAGHKLTPFRRKHEDSGGAFRMQVYSPFVAINKTGFPIVIKSGGNKMLAGQVGNGTLLGAARVTNTIR